VLVPTTPFVVLVIRPVLPPVMDLILVIALEVALVDSTIAVLVVPLALRVIQRLVFTRLPLVPLALIPHVLPVVPVTQASINLLLAAT